MARPPVDPRLWRYARSARRYLLLSVGLSLVTTGAIVVAAVTLGRVLAGVITDPARRDIGSWAVELVVLALAVGGRASAAWLQARIAHRAGAAVVAELEQSVLTAGAGLPPRESESRRTELSVVVSSGLRGLRGYLTGYLPALLLAILVPPVVWVVIAAHDPTAAIIVVITVPLIPIFMILIGLLTEGRARATLDATTRLSDQLLDLFAGMPTLRALGRETPVENSESPLATMRPRVRRLGEELHRRTMSALRTAFLSSMVLELLATLSVALVAVSIGLRLVSGEMDLYAGLVALVLAPEVYLPLRTVGERFHAAQDGMAAAERAFAVLEPASGESGAGESEKSAPVVVPSGGGVDTGAESASEVVPSRECARAVLGSATGFVGEIELRDLTVSGRDGAAPDGLTAILRPGAVTMLTGPNGSGKSTVLQAILGLIQPDRGSVHVDGINIRDLPAERWWSQVAWLPQRPVLVPGTLRENLELLGTAAPDQASWSSAKSLERACVATGFDTVLAELSDGWDTVVGMGGAGLSLGQRQRLALTRVLAAERPVLLLDEPTAHLDSDSEITVAAALRDLARAGAIVVVVAHRPSLLTTADLVVPVPSGRNRVHR
ncbi:thiol reductant ABC exporter subunit CydD [Nocardia paucivorans]|uniref:thiol reductant ABC exporter subunit CydD n=1 Tax=Nocardia paucivorans TaxID=114259 RepID=UPI000316BFE4|nr:thiol reductant ABC exporter subunit CydD [Nocardia paucivorans]